MADRSTAPPRQLVLMLRLAVFGLIVIAGVAIFGALFVDLEAHEWVQGIEKTIASWGPWGIIVSMGFMVLHSFVPFPAEFLAVANGMLYGPYLGTAITWSGAMLGAHLAFALSRLLGRPFVEAMLAQPQSDLLNTWTEQRAAHWIFLARFVPVISFNLVNYVAGLTGISWWTFTWTTALGILPLTALMVTMGAQAHELAWQWWLVLMAGGIVAWLLLRRWLRASS